MKNPTNKLTRFTEKKSFLKISSVLKTSFQEMRITQLAISIILFASLLSFSSCDSDSDDLASEIPCSPNLTSLANFNALNAQMPENITVDHSGDIYLAMSPLGEIWKVDPSGSFKEVVATFPEEDLFGVSGLRFDDQGSLYVTNGSPKESAHGVWKIGSGGAKELVAGTGNIPLPNDLVISPNRTLYIAGSITGAIWRVLPGGSAEIWVQDEILEGTGAFGLGFPIGANGIAFVPGGFMVANTEKGQLVFVPIKSDGSAGQPEVVVADPSLFGLDGIAADSEGNIYGAVNAGNNVVRISQDGTDISVIVSGDLMDFPTGVSFGNGSEKNTLFMVNAAFIHFLSDPPTPESANPSLLRLNICPTI